MARARKSAGGVAKKPGGAVKNAGRALKNAGRALKKTGARLADTAVRLAEEPRLPAVALVAPERTGRSVENEGEALKEIRRRLLLAWKHRKSLDAALPSDPPFHPTAWTAYRALVRVPKSGGGARGKAGALSPDEALDALLKATGRLRNVVELTTRPEDPARKALKFGEVLKATRALPALAAEVIAGARSVRARFPALTDKLIDNADAALATAKQVVGEAERAEEESAIGRVERGDERQLAWDVLLDCVDHLRAAAIAELEDARPKLAEALTGPLEPQQRAKPTPGQKPAPEPAPN